MQANAAFTLVDVSVDEPVVLPVVEAELVAVELPLVVTLADSVVLRVLEIVWDADVLPDVEAVLPKVLLTVLEMEIDTEVDLVLEAVVLTVLDCDIDADVEILFDAVDEPDKLAVVVADVCSVVLPVDEAELLGDVYSVLVGEVEADDDLVVVPLELAVVEIDSEPVVDAVLERVNEPVVLIVVEAEVVMLELALEL